MTHVFVEENLLLYGAHVTDVSGNDEGRRCDDPHRELSTVLCVCHARTPWNHNNTRSVSLLSLSVSPSLFLSCDVYYDALGHTFGQQH